MSRKADAHEGGEGTGVVSLPQPYYQHAGITIYHSDCRELLPLIGPCDVVLTDPPYGIDGGRSGGVARGKGDYIGNFSDTPEYIKSVVVPVITDLIQRVPCVVLTPGNRCLSAYPQPSSFGAFYQPAAVGLQSFGNLDAQPIFYYGTAGGGRMGKPCSYVLTETPEKNGHPCPKPYSAWRRLLATVSAHGQRVLDPFMGSGTTLLAAKDLGLCAVGIELEERYCEIAAKRLSQDVFDFDAPADSLYTYCARHRGVIAIGNAVKQADDTYLCSECSAVAS